MSFVSIEFFALFVIVLFLLAVFRESRAGQKIVILSASCIFYAYWDWRFLGLLILVTLLDYFISRRIHETDMQSAKRRWLMVSIVFNLSVLGFFKYYNFFTGNLNALLGLLGLHLPELSIILPVGISFYIFETLSYVIDVYHGTARPANSLLDYAVFISFFPRLVAGPIMRATQFLPQLYRGIVFSRNNLLLGAELFAQGLIKKVVVADSIAYLVDTVYGDPMMFNSATIYLAILSYSIQIYFDFSGYSDMALGVARILGFELPANFNYPYISQSITEFWKRWHISLSSWLRDYLYIPLGGNRRGNIRTYLNLMLTMLIGGLWHGASWNFVFWGGLHGAYLGLERYFGGSAEYSNPVGLIYSWSRSLLTFVLVSFTWIFFRSPSFDTTLIILNKILFLNPSGVIWIYVPAIVFTIAVFWGGLLVTSLKLPVPWQSDDVTAPNRVAFLVFEYVTVLLFFTKNITPFIYFQF